LSGNECSLVSTDEETGSTTHKCPGVGDYSLLVHDDDSRMSITVVSPDGTKSGLDLWSVVTTAFSTLGEKAEWRTAKQNGKIVPISLIVRVNASIQEDPDRPQKKSYLAIAKLGGKRSCVVDVIDDSPTANEAARKAADEAENKECKNASNR
jgi:hypothetical protein